MPVTAEATELTRAWARCRAAPEHSAHARLSRFAPGRTGDVSHTRLALDAVARGVSLLTSGGGSKAMSRAWRFVQAYTGFEALARALLDAQPGAGLRRHDPAALLGCCRLPAYEPLAAPEGWSPDAGLASYLGLDPAAAGALEEWGRQPVADWASALALAAALRDAVSCGLLTDIGAEIAARLLADLAHVAAAA